MSSDNWTFLAIMISLIVAAIMHSNSKAENLFRSTPRSYERKSIGPVYTKELERKLIKAEALRPTGPFVVLHATPPPARKIEATINDMDRSSLSSIIIREVLSE